MVKHLYIHVPFCHRICPYCSFYKHTFGDINQSELVESLLKEISLRRKDHDFNIETIYLGGGTPSALSYKYLERLLSGINEQINLTDLDEWGVEVNPSTFDHKKASMMKNHGVSRISLGIQSWNGSILKTLGRDHSPSDAEESFNILKSCQFKSLNIDLMFSIPGQSLNDWERDLQKTISLNPEHISAYNLNYEEDTEFFDRLKSGEFFEDPEKDGDHFSCAMSKLASAGYNHYEISNYALTGHESKHNSSYWRGVDYLGIGPGAFSTLKRKRWRNVPDTKKYISLLHNNSINLVETEIETINDSSYRVERIALQLRTSEG
ncbi:MAG: radical SAM family heme chaperone HemW, partial [Verrucomicrobiales bacterium]